MFSVRIDLHRDCVKSLFKTFFLMRARHFCRDFTTSRTERTDARIYWAASTSSWTTLSSCRQDIGTSPPYCRRCNLSEKRSARNRSGDKNLKRRKVEDIFTVTEVTVDVDQWLCSGHWNVKCTFPKNRTVDLWKCSQGTKQYPQVTVQTSHYSE